MCADAVNGALNAARATVTKAKLRFPAIPPELQENFRKYRNWCWAPLQPD